MQQIFDEELFNQCSHLFIAKWQQINIVSEFINEFRQNYLNHHKNWFESHNIFGPSTNNSLERYNLTINTKYTQRNSLKILNFLEDICFEIISDESKETSITENLIKMKHNEPTCLISPDNTKYYFQIIKENSTEKVLMVSSSQI